MWGEAMSSLDKREAVGGGLLIATGAAFAIYAGANYSIGSISRMGPGMIPVALGVLLAIFGGILILGATRSINQHIPIRVEVPLIILASVLVFGLLIGTLGLLPAVAGCVIVATLADRPINLAFSLVLAAVMCLLAWVIFIFALGLTIPMFVWPF